MVEPVPDQLQAALDSSYTLERELGRGGMATVYLARDAKHGRAVALKVLHPDLAASLGPDRFRREISFAATLSHPHILTVLDSGETSAGQLWFTMPYVEGETLRDRLRRERQLPVDDALRVTREVAGALTHAHEHGVIHRDIKPENILLTLHGDALLADFGIARALTPRAAERDRGERTLTDTGLAVGTPQYMSPEQASGERELTARSDIYSLGTVLYEMLDGQPPFTGPTPQAVIAKVLSSEAPSVRRSRPAVPAGVDAALRSALAPVPADRWASADEFAKALESAERAALTTAAAPAAIPSTQRPRVPVAALALGLGFMIGVGVLYTWRAKNSAEKSGASSGAVRLAVLPFENVGDSSDSYFAEGMTDAVREKLTSLTGLEERLLLRARPSDLDADTSAWGIVLAHQYAYRHEPARARAYADSVLEITRDQARLFGDDQRLLSLGLVLAYLGRAREAIDAGKRAVALPYVAGDGINGPYDHQLLARIYMMAGERGRAIDELERVLARPYNFSPAWLRIDPTWADLRGEPRFVRLTQGA